jgi:hypothetical protein
MVGTDLMSLIRWGWMKMSTPWLRAPNCGRRAWGNEAFPGKHVDVRGAVVSPDRDDATAYLNEARWRLRIGDGDGHARVARCF